MIALTLSACGSSNDNTTTIPTLEPTTPDLSPKFAAGAEFYIGLLPDTQGGTDAEGQAHVAMHQMAEVLIRQSNSGVDLLITLSNLIDNGSF